MKKRRLIVGLSGASGAILGIRLLEALQRSQIFETHLILSEGAHRTILDETEYSLEQVSTLADVCHDLHNVGAPIASGSFPVEGMVILPCSMKTLAGIACGYSENLLLRAADVTLKERRPLVLAVRETPLSPIHLRNMLTLSQAGALILPPMLSYYNHPQSVDDITEQFVRKVLDRFGVAGEGYRRWEG